MKCLIIIGTGGITRLGSVTEDHRIPILQTGTHEFLIAVPGKGRIGIWRIGASLNPKRVHQFALADEDTIPVCAFDPAMGRLALTTQKEILVFEDCLRADGISPQTIPHDSDSDEITALCFAQYGRVLVWGTDDGKVFTSKRHGF